MDLIFIATPINATESTRFTDLETFEHAKIHLPRLSEENLVHINRLSLFLYFILDTLPTTSKKVFLINSIISSIYCYDGFTV